MTAEGNGSIVHGWQDPDHQWRWTANLPIFEVVHQMVIRVGLFTCKQCGVLRTGPWNDSEPAYETPVCTPATTIEGADSG